MCNNVRNVVTTSKHRLTLSFDEPRTRCFPTGFIDCFCSQVVCLQGMKIKFFSAWSHLAEDFLFSKGAQLEELPPTGPHWDCGPAVVEQRGPTVSLHSSGFSLFLLPTSAFFSSSSSSSRPHPHTSLLLLTLGGTDRLEEAQPEPFLREPS